MTTQFLMAIALGASLLSGPLQGVWVGSVETPHGAAPLLLTVGPRDSSATFEMTFLDAPMRGSVLEWKVAADSVWFGIPFTTNMGPSEFRFFGRVSGATLAGTFVGTTGGQEMSRGRWTTTRR